MKINGGESQLCRKWLWRMYISVSIWNNETERESNVKKITSISNGGVAAKLAL
jgi:hypothetical protein